MYDKMYMYQLNKNILFNEPLFDKIRTTSNKELIIQNKKR